MPAPNHRSPPPPAADRPPSLPAAERDPPPFDAALKRLARLLVGVEAYRKNRRAAADLAMLDDHLLADIGLRRSDLPHGRRGPQRDDRWPTMADGCPR